MTPTKDDADNKEASPLLGTTSNPRKDYMKAGPWSLLVFGWFTPVLDLMQAKLDNGISPDLEDPDIPPLPTHESSEFLLQHFESTWKQEQEQKKVNASLAWCLWKSYSPLFLKAGILKAIHDCLQFVGPQVLNCLVQFLRSPTENLSEGLMLTLAVTFSQLIMNLCLRHYFFMCYRVSIRIRTTVLLAIYRKALTIDSSFYQSHPIGQITNLMSVDTQRIQDVVSMLHAIWYSLLQVALSIYFLWQQLGPSCLAGVFVIILSIPLTAVTAKWMGSLQKKLMGRKDDRVQTNQETISNMKVVKLQAWEGPFRDRVLELRRLELRQLLAYSLAGATTFLLWSAVPLLIALATFGAYVGVFGHALDVASALTALALFAILRFPLFMFPQLINMLVEANVAVKRIEAFLNAPDHIPPKTLENDDSKVIRVENGSFSYQDLYTPDKANPTLQDTIERTEKELLLIKAKLADAEDLLAQLEGTPKLKRYGSTMVEHDDDGGVGKVLSLKRLNFDCNQGEFVVVVGAVGSGKSSFLKSILGEVGKVSGEVNVRGKVAYFDQKPFIMNDTVKGNILFGKPLDDEDLYKRALTTSCLEHDLTLLPGGELCEIGEKGITLSGGQKARISMARAVYHDADVSLLDDCLSAVDAHVGRDLFEHCIVQTMLGRGNTNSDRKRTVILVTNALQYLSHPMVDRIVVMKHGHVVETGSYKDLIAVKDSHFQKFLKAFKDTSSGDYGEDEKSAAASSKPHEPAPLETAPLEELLDGEDKEAHSAAADNAEKDPVEKPKGLMSDEMAEREIGRVGKEVYITWAKAAGGVAAIPLILFVFTLGEGTSFLSNWWLTYWSNNAGDDVGSQLHFLGIYGLINLATIATEFLRMAVVVVLAFIASRKLFVELLDSIMRSPMSFFDTTPAGRIMNRFSKDIYTIDETLPQTFRMYLTCLFGTMSTLVIITGITPLFGLTLLPILYFYGHHQAYFSQCYRELKRIDSVTRSPIYALFGETLDGPATVRAFGAQAPLFDRMGRLVDEQQHAYFLTQAGLSWLAVRLEFVGTMIVTTTCLAAVFEKRSFPDGDQVFAGLAGLSISYALAVTQQLNWAVRVGSDFEANMVSVERLRQYCNLPSEAENETDFDKTLDQDWPHGGAIQFQSTKLRYRPDLPLVLKGLNLDIPPRSKVGIVGRTGAGKSTLMAALMRLVELDGGSIEIGGVNTRKLGLYRLRSSIAVIPQDPVLFSGSVKTNLDPFDEHNEDDLKDSLQRVGLWTSEQTSPVKSLSDAVQQDGQNFSVGQRQLLVIARALLDGAGVVICDEATAAIDAEADARIQKVLRNDFKDATTLTVAHRLNTIMDSTHILVMNDGKCAEFDTPANLLNRGGLFKDLVDAWEKENTR
eukprot:Nitzschia sp. Nitz4//scaffold39_size137210//112596//117089//NITZ4_003219-RA/size137210-augustus-gene-0.186-mRNA-1//1//CDS//3329550443//9265//frame0